MSSLSEAQKAEYQEAFALFDTDGEGTVTLSQVGTVLRSLGQTPTEAELAQVLSGVSGDTVDFEGFCEMMTQNMVTSEQAQEEIRSAFQIFDKKSTGFVSAAELRHVLVNMGEKLTEEEVDELMKEADIDDQGKLSWESFLKNLF